MDKNKEIDALYKVLGLYEDLENGINGITLESYLNYLDRLYVLWLGKGNEEISDSLKGLWKLGENAGHKRVKSTIFHLMGAVKNGV